MHKTIETIRIKYKEGIDLYEKFGFRIEISLDCKSFTLYYNDPERDMEKVINSYNINQLEINKTIINIKDELISIGFTTGKRVLRKQIKELIGIYA